MNLILIAVISLGACLRCGGERAFFDQIQGDR